MEEMSNVQINQSEAAIYSIDQSDFRHHMLAHLWPRHKVPDEEAGLGALSGEDLRPGAGQADWQQEHSAPCQLGGGGAPAGHLRHRSLAWTLGVRVSTENWAWVMLVTWHASGGRGGYWDTTSNTQGASWYRTAHYKPQVQFPSIPQSPPHPNNRDLRQSWGMEKLPGSVTHGSYLSPGSGFVTHELVPWVTHGSRPFFR